MKKIFLILIACVFAGLQVFADEIVPPGQAFAEQLKKERAATINALNLSESQTQQYVEMVSKRTDVLDQKFRELYSESDKLKKMRVANADKVSISTQQKLVNELKKEVKKLVAQEDKELKKILNHEQRSKFRMITKLERKAMKQKQTDYYKKNPKMRPFACPKKVYK